MDDPFAAFLRSDVELEGSDTEFATPCKMRRIEIATDEADQKTAPVGKCIQDNCESLKGVDCSDDVCPSRCVCANDKCGSEIDACLADATCANLTSSFQNTDSKIRRIGATNSLDLNNLIHSNLGGHGPDSGDEGMVFANVLPHSGQDVNLVATDEKLKAATEIREKEAADFAIKEKDLVETIDTLERAIRNIDEDLDDGIIEKEMKGGALMMALSKLQAIVNVQSLSSADGDKLTALIQNTHSSEDEDSGVKGWCGVLDVLNDLLEKAQGELDSARQTETTDINNYQMLKQSLTDEIKFANKENVTAVIQNTDTAVYENQSGGIGTPMAKIRRIGDLIGDIGDLNGGTKVEDLGEITTDEADLKAANDCKDLDVQYEIKTGKPDVAGLEAAIAKEASNIDSQTAKMEELAGATATGEADLKAATDEADLKAATEIREKEAADFAIKEKDLVETIGTLERAIGIIEKEMKGGASMMELSKAANVVQALQAMVNAQSLSSADGDKLTALIQNTPSSEDEDSGAPDVLDVLNDLFAKALGELESARQTERTDINNYQMLKQSSTDEIKFANKENDEAHKSKSVSAEADKYRVTFVMAAEGDLDVTSKDLAEDTATAEGDLDVTSKDLAEDMKVPHVLIPELCIFCQIADSRRLRRCFCHMLVKSL